MHKGNPKGNKPHGTAHIAPTVAIMGIAHAIQASQLNAPSA